MLGLFVLIATTTFALKFAFRNSETTTTERIVIKIFSIICICLLAISVLLCIIAIGLSCETNTYNVLEQRYEFIQTTYMVYKTHTRIDGNAWLHEIYDYNQKVYILKARALNPWTSWFVNKKRAEGLKVVEFENGILKQEA